MSSQSSRQLPLHTLLALLLALVLVTSLFGVYDTVALVTPLWSVTHEATISHFIIYEVWQLLTPSSC